MNAADLREYTRTLEELARRKRENKLAYFEPYAKQREFFALGLTKRERDLAAGNQLGKTEAGGFEFASHLCGIYPSWWSGKRFEGAITGWASGVTNESTRDVVQRKLLGDLDGGEYGSGFIPKEKIVSVTHGRGINGAVDTVLIRHSSGGTSTLQFKSYERGREKWQGASCEVIWFDEEPPLDIYSEGLARIAARKGIVFLTATPLLGLSGVQSRFFNETHEDRGLVRMEMGDALHISEAERERIESGYLDHERDARVRGLPMLGSGRIFPVAESAISVPAFTIPSHWARIAAMDFGWDHPTTCAWLAWDRDSDTVYLTDTYKASKETVAVHAAAIKSRGDVPTAWPHDGMQADRSSGDPIATLYRKLGVKMLPERATFADGSNSVEAGILDMLDRMETGRFKVFGHLQEFWDEFRQYHRVEGRILKERDDVISAVRYAIMSLRHARTSNHFGRPRVQQATGMDHSPLGESEQPRGAIGVSWGDPWLRRDRQRERAPGVARDLDN